MRLWWLFDSLNPYAGATAAEYFRDLGRDALVVYDDLTKRRDTSCCFRYKCRVDRRPYSPAGMTRKDAG